MANSNPGLVKEQEPTAADWNSYFTAKVDAFAGIMTSGTIVGTTIDSSVIGGQTAAAGSFTEISINATGSTLVPPTPADTMLHLVGSVSKDRLLLDAFNQINISARRANGVPGTPSALASGQPIVVFEAGGYGATGYGGTHRANMTLRAAEDWTDAHQGAGIDFLVTKNGGTVSAVALAIDNDGIVLIGTNAAIGSTGTDVLQVVGGLSVDRMDVSNGGTIAGDLTVSGNLYVLNRENNGMNVPIKAGVVLSPTSTSGAFDTLLVEGPSIWWDPTKLQWGMVYVGLNSTTEAIGLAWSSDLISWYKDSGSPILQASGTGGAPDFGGVTGPYIWLEGGTYYLYYIGCTVAGYEQGVLKLCLATASSITGTWTRHGAVIGLGTVATASAWRDTAIYHPNIVKSGSTYYLFFNASNGTLEQIGYATASSPGGPWTVDDANSPIVPVGAGGSFDSQHTGDPFVYKIGSTWYMMYAGYNGSVARNGVATTTAALFPLGWTKFAGNPVLPNGPTQSIDFTEASKPCIVQNGDQLYHFYTAVGATEPPSNSQGRQIALAIHGASGDMAASEFCRVTASGSISISNNAATALTWTGIDFQSGPVTHWAVGNATRIVCQRAGIYAIKARIYWASNATGVRDISIKINGSTTIAQADVMAVTGFSQGQIIDAEYQMSVGDYVEIIVFQNSGGSLNVTQTGQWTPYASIRRMK